MKVKCKHIYNEIKKEYQLTSSALTVGKEYLVIEIYISSEMKIRYRLPCDQNNQPALFDASQFEIVSERIPSTWIVRGKGALGNTGIVFGPKVLQEPGLWERIFDQDEEALKIYRREGGILMAEEGMSSL